MLLNQCFFSNLNGINYIIMIGILFCNASMKRNSLNFKRLMLECYSVRSINYRGREIL